MKDFISLPHFLFIITLFFVRSACLNSTSEISLYHHSLISNCSIEESLSSPNGELDYYFYPMKYPSNTKCRWRIYSQPYHWIKLIFGTIQTECSYDVIDVYEANSTSETRFASLCGNETYPLPLVLVFNSSEVVVQFTSDEDISSYGFKASYVAVSPCDSNCSNHGVCLNNKECICDATHTGLLCERETRGDTPLDPRYDQAAFYNASRDSLLIAGGKDMQESLRWSMFEYDFTTSNWSNVTNKFSGTLSAQHFFQYNGSLYLLSQTNFWRLWKYEERTRLWQPIRSRSDVYPPFLNYTSIIAAEMEKKVYLLGGGTQPLSKFLPNRNLYAFDFETSSWIQLSSTYFRFSAVHGIYGSPAVYRPSTRFIYVFAPAAIYLYHVPSDLWHTVGYDDLTGLSLWTFHTATFAEPFVVFSGGQLSPFQALGASRPCFNSLVFILDLDCWTLTSLPYGDVRASHSSFLRNGRLWIFGGHRGIALNDFFSTPSLDFPAVNESCRALTWCSRYNDCEDCLLIPGCGWCQDTCSYGCTKRICPSRKVLRLSESYDGLLPSLSYLDFKVYINEPDQDIFFYFRGDKTLNLSILNLPSKLSLHALGPLVMFPFMDPRRFGGWYVFRINNPNLDSVDFQLSVSLQIPSMLTSPVDINPYLSLGFGIMSLFLSMCLVMKRYRDNSHRRNTCVNSNPSMIVPMYIADSAQLRQPPSKSICRNSTIPQGTQERGPIPISAHLHSPFVYVSYLVRMPSPDSDPLRIMVATGTYRISTATSSNEKKYKARIKKKKPFLSIPRLAPG